MTPSKLEAYIEILKAINTHGTTRRQNVSLKRTEYRRAIDFLVSQKVIIRCSSAEKNNFRVTQRGTAILRYFAPQRGCRFEMCLEDLEFTE